jgi:hypothetical protein
MDANLPMTEADRKDDPILYTALIADADLLIADDKHLVPDRMKSFGSTAIAW